MKPQVMKKLLTLLSLICCSIPNNTLAQNLDFTVALVGADFSTQIFLDSQPGLITDMPYWSVGESPEWADVSIASDIVGSPNDFDFIIEYYLIISGVPSPNNIGENIVTANLINPWTGDIVDITTTIINVIETANCVCPAVYDPVCSSDGITYGNSCEAACVGADILYDGACETSGCTANDGTFYVNGDSWNPDDCTFCSCEEGDIMCAVVDCAWPDCDNPIYIDGQCCPICPEEEGCFDAAGMFYENGASWNPDACTDCFCEQGDIMCASEGCLEPNCTDPIYIDGECCPICPDDCEENLDDEILALVEMFGVYDCETAVAVLTEFSIGCDMDLAAFGPIVGIEIEPETFLNDYCPCSCESGNDILGCTDPQAINYNPMATTENGSCEYMIDYGCIGEDGDLFPIGAIIEYDNEVCFCVGSDATVFPTMAFWQCEEIISMGCMDEDAINFNPQASVDDGSCIYSTNNGCTADNGVFYPIGATFTNFDPSIGVCEMCFCHPNPNSDNIEGLWECEEIIDCGFGMIPGCMDPFASNYNEWANVDDGTCEYGCNCPLDLWAPVCGENGLTYAYDCFAECEGVAFTDGACMDPCELMDCEFGCINGECIEPTDFGCTENGEWYPFGAILEVECNTCACTPGFNPNAEGFWMCTLMACEEGCWEDGEFYQIGSELFINECEYLECESPNNWTDVMEIPDCGQTDFGCTENGDWYPVGAIIENGCEVCFCEYSSNILSPEWLCEEIDDCGECSDIECPSGTWCNMGECIPIEPNDFGCTSDDGEWYPFGAIIEVECNTCSCTPGFNPNAEGFWMCTMMPCEDEGCWENGEFYQIGSELFLNECEYLECEGENNWSDVMEIPGCGQTDFGCELDGEIYAYGTTVQQGCNSCYCQDPNIFGGNIVDGYWSCTEMACSGCTDPDALNYDEYADWDDGSCEYNNTTPNWDFTITGNNHTLVLQEDMLTDLFGTPIAVGDWIGTFFEVNGELICAGYTVWEGTTTVIPAQGDDLTTDFQDGFTTGETFQWMVWDVSENIAIYANATYVQETQSTYVANGISTITSITSAPLITDQNVELNIGWNMFSTYMHFEGMNILDVFEPYAEDVVIVKNYIGEAYLPDWDFDGIGAMIPGQGYQAKMNTDKTILFEGDYLTPEDHPILLESGWNMFAYLRTEPAPTIDVFSEIDDLVIVKDNLGMAYLPEFDFDGIGLMQAGKGYQAKVLSEQVLEYLPNDTEYRMTLSEVKTELDHFIKPINTGSNMSLVLPANTWVNKPMPSDEIAVYDSHGLLVGAMPYQKGNLVIPIYGDDELSPEKDGLSTGETFSLSLWSDSNEREYRITVTWNEETTDYQKDDILYASQLDFTQEQNSLHSVHLFPNPTDLRTELHAVLEKDSRIEISIFNLLGENVFKSVKNYQKGAVQQVLNIEHLPAGSYLIQLKTNDELFNKSLIVK